MFNFKFFRGFLIVFLGVSFQFNLYAQCYTPPNYCTNISATNVSNYGMGIQNVTMGSIVNSTSSGSGNPIYFDYSNLSTTVTPGTNQNFSIKVGNSNQTTFRIYVDWNQDGVFNTTAPELCYTSVTTIANGVVASTFPIPAGQAVGVYRLRVASDYTTAPGPCGPLVYSAEIEDYSLAIYSGSPDASVGSIVAPSMLAVSPSINSASFKIRNTTNVNMTAVSAGYSINGGAPTVQTFTGLSIAPGALYTVAFSTGFTIPSIGNYSIKYWLYNVNGVATQVTPLNDTICQTLPLLCTGPLSGTYTINASGGITSTNFQSFTNAVNALKTCGISGPVSFSVAANTYTDTLYIPNIAGVSATNTITFEGGDGNKATRILTFPTSSIANAVVRFNGSRYVTIRNMTLRSTGSAQGWVVHFMNDSVDRVSNCTIDFFGAATSSSSSSFMGMVLNNSLTTYSTQSPNCRKITIDSNLINYGYIGISSSISNGAYTNFFRRNTISNSYFYGIYSNGNQVVKINNNNIIPLSLAPNTSGIYIINSNATSPSYHDISYNKIDNAGQNGIYLNSSNGTSTANNLITNNLITGFRNTSGYFGIYLANSNYSKVYHNSINCNFAAFTGISAGIYNTSSFNIQCINNNIGVLNTTSFNTFPLYANSTGLFTTLDYNNYYNASSPNLLQINGVNLNASNFKTASPANGGANSLNEDPSFVSATNLHVTHPCLNGIGGIGIADDYDMETRAAIPDMGADEMVSIPNDDLKLNSITTPNFPLTVGTQTVSVVIKNVGNNTVNTFNVSYTLNNGTVITEAYSGAPIAPCGTSTYTFTTKVTIPSGSNNFKVYTSLPNGVSDASFNNDTMQWTLCPAMSGTYTINPLGSGSTNYTNFASAIAALNCGGISGPVTFNVSNGTYAEQLIFTPINGASAVNTIKFQSASGIAANCIVRFITSSSQSVLELNGADYITFDKITFKNNFTSTCFGIWLRNGADFNTISNCIVDMSTSGVLGYGIYQNSTFDSKNLINNNTINGAAYGIWMNSSNVQYSNRNIISNNKINNSFYYGIYAQYQDSLIVTSNNIVSNSSSNNYSAIYLYWLQKGPVLTKNKIAYTTSSSSVGNFYGINLTYFNVNSSNPTRGLCANNMIQVGGNFSTSYGIYVNTTSNYSDFIHNTVNMTNGVANGSYAWYSISGLNNDTVRNNIFHNYGNGTNSGYAAYIYSGTNLCFDKNDFYTRNSVFGFYNGVSYATYALWKSAAVAGITGFETGGVNREVSFVSSSDLHTTTACIADLGFNYSATSPSPTKILDDFDSQSRSTSPDLGCDEFALNSYDIASQAIVSPVLSAYALATPYTIKVKIKNNGSTTITALTMNYSVNGTVTSESFTGLNLLSCDTTTLTFTTSMFLSSTGSNLIKVFNGLINSTNSDLNNSNDTITTIFCTPYTGEYTINQLAPLSATNFTSVNQAISALYSCGISGSVRLRIAVGSGPYNEQVTFNGLIPGISLNNYVRLSGNTSRESITFSPTISNAQHTIRLISTKHIILDSLTIINTGTNFGVGVHLVSTSDSNYITNSQINISLANTSFSNSAGIAISANTSSVSGVGNNGNYNIFYNNNIEGGFFGISAIGTNSSILCKGNEVNNNRLNGQANTAVYWQYQDLTKVNGNAIDNMLSSNIGSIGIFFQNIERFELNKNRINRVGQYGIYMQSSNYQLGTGTSRSQIVNNMVGGIFYNANPMGVYLSNQARNIDIWHNTINVMNLGIGAAFWMQYTTPGFYSGIDMRNNSITATNQLNYVAYLYYSPNVPFINFNNNNIYGSNLLANQALFGGGCSYATNQWIGVPCGGMSTSTSLWLPPQLNNDATDLHSVRINLSNVGSNIGAVTSDIDGDSRPLSPSSTVDIGADEYNVFNYNIGASAIVNPNVPLVTGLQNVIVKIENYGISTITSANVNYKIGVNGAVKTFAWSGSLVNGASTNIIFTGVNQYNFTGSYDTIIAWTDNPNGVADEFVFNDTFINQVVCQPLNGIYTLNPGLPASFTNFVSFNALAFSLNNCGVTGAVTINVAPGVYNEQIELRQIIGSSTNNKITIQSASGIASSVVLQFNSAIAASNNYVVNLKGADFFIFKDMTIGNSNVTIGANIIWLTNNARYNSFNNVTFNGSTSGSTGNNYAIIFASNIGGLNVNQGDDNNSFNLCNFNNGSYGVYLNGQYGSYYSNNTSITNCNFNNQSLQGIYLNYHFNINIIGNNIITNTGNSFVGISFYGAGITNYGITKISKNNIIISNNGQGINLQYFIGMNTYVVNNMIKIGSGTGTANGIYSAYSMCKIYNNTINVTSGLTNSPAVYLQYGCCYTPYVDFKYNIVANSGNGVNSGLCIYSDVNNIANMKIDSNVYFQGAGAVNFGSLNGTLLANFASWKTAMGVAYDNGSIVANPNFLSTTNLHINNPTNLLNMNINENALDDIDNIFRCGITDAGADHHPNANDIGVSVIQNPYGGSALSGVQDIVLVIKNYGSNNITSANVSYNINGTIQTKSWTGNLSNCATDTIVFNAAQQYNFTGPFVIKAYTSNPNGLTDVNVLNDTIQSSGCVGMTGVYTINPSGSGPFNFINFTSAISAMQTCGIGGPITFQVAASTYRERVIIPAISGSNSTNTITFDGGNGNASTRIIQWPGTLANPAIVLFNATSNVILKNLSINASSVNNHYNVNFYNSLNCKLIKCILTDSSNVSDPVSSTNSFRILLSGSPNSNAIGTINNNIYIDSNITNNGYYALYSNMNNGANTIFIRNNTINNPSMGTMLINGSQTVKIIGNIFRPKFRGSYANPQQGVYLLNAMTNGINYHEILNNISDSTFGYAYQFANSSGSYSNFNIFANNVVYGNKFTGSSGTTNNSSFWKIYHNSILLDLNTYNTSYCYSQTGGVSASIDIRNNIFVVSNSAQIGAIPVNISTSSVIANFDYNNLYNASSTYDLIRINSAYYRSISAFPTGIGANSKNIDPKYFGPNNLHIPNGKACELIGVNGLGISYDMDYQTRSVNSPVMGADEVFNNVNDLSVDAVTQPSTSTIIAGINNLKLRIKNVGSNTINSGNLTYIFNGASPVTVALPSAIGPCDTTIVTISGLNMLAGTNTFVAFTSSPNGSTDSYFGNDTLKTSFCTKLNGTYTIGGASPNFVNFNAAVDALNCGGIIGPVVFKVRTGTYNEAIQINKIFGSNDTNTVIFQSESGIASSVILQNNVTGSFTIRLYNASNVSFKNMTIATNMPNTNAVQIYASWDSCKNISLYGNTIYSQWFVTSSYAAVYASGYCPNLTIRKNTISRSAFGVYIIGNTVLTQYNPNTIIDSNQFTNFFGSDDFTAISILYCSNPKISNNSIQKNGCCADQGIIANFISNGGEISYNKIITTSGFYMGINLQNVNLNTETTPLYVFNNFIVYSSGANYGIYVYNASYVYIFNNSFNCTGGNAVLYVNNVSGSNNNIRIVNNSFKSATGLVSLSIQGSSLATAKSMIAECDYNNYYQGSGSVTENILNLQGTLYTMATAKGAIKSSPMSDSNSITYDPKYKSYTDLHIDATSGLEGRGKLLSNYFLYDIDGTKRLSHSFDIGADDTAVLRTTVGDYTNVSNCVNVSGSNWVDMTDNQGKLVFSINAEGNNLGPTCWGFRLNAGAIRKDSITNSADGLKYLSYFLDRNIYINPTFQPIPGSKVSIKFYCKQTEWQKFVDSAAFFGMTLSKTNTKVHRFHEPTPSASLTPLVSPTMNDSSHFLFVNAISGFGSDKYLLFQTNHFSQFNPVFIPNVNPYVLPVTWLNFDAYPKEKNAILNWSTASEKNSDYFEIQRSSDGIKFSSIGRVKSAGNSIDVKKYSYTDNQIGNQMEKVYYRIKQVDLDQQYNLTKIKMVAFTENQNMNIHYIGPNPCSSDLNIEFNLNSAEKTTIELYDIAGQIVQTSPQIGVKGMNSYKLNMNDISNGVYVLKIISGNSTFEEKIIKQQ